MKTLNLQTVIIKISIIWKSVAFTRSTQPVPVGVLSTLMLITSMSAYHSSSLSTSKTVRVLKFKSGTWALRVLVSSTQAPTLIAFSVFQV